MATVQRMQKVARLLVLAVGMSLLILWMLVGRAPARSANSDNGVAEATSEPNKEPGLFQVMDGMTCHYVPARSDRYCERIDYNLTAVNYTCKEDPEFLDAAPTCIGDHGPTPERRTPGFTGDVCTVVGSSTVVMTRNYTDVICASDVLVYAGSANDYELSCGNGKHEPEAVAVFSSSHYKKKQYKKSTMDRIAKRKKFPISGLCEKPLPDANIPMSPWFWGAVTIRPLIHSSLGTGFSALAEALAGCDHVKVIGFFPSDYSPDGLRIGYSNYRGKSKRLNQTLRYRYMMAMSECGLIEWIV